MFKKVALFALIATALGTAVSQPALAQDGYYGPQDRYYQNDRAWGRGGFDARGQGWRDDGWRDRRADERREREWRKHERKEQERRERQRWNNGYYRNYNPGYYSGYGR